MTRNSSRIALNKKLNELKAKFDITIKINSVPESEPSTFKSYNYTFSTNSGELLGVCSVYYDSRTEIEQNNRRGINAIIDSAIHIPWIKVEKRGIIPQLGSFMFIYSIVNVIKKHPNCKQAFLDDCTDNSNCIKTNFWYKMGFTHKELVELNDNDPNKIVLPGPEVCGELGEEIYGRWLNILNTINIMPILKG